MKRKLAYLVMAVLLAMLLAPAAPAEKVEAARNAATEMAIKDLPNDNTVWLKEDGSYSYDFNYEVLATEKGKGKATSVVWWEINSKAKDTAGVTSSRSGCVYPVYTGSFEIRALAFASTKDMEAWKKARKANGNVATDKINAKYATAWTDWAEIKVASEKDGLAVVHSQYQLGLALKNKNCTDIHIVTESAKTFTISTKNYLKRSLTINAPKAEIENAGRFAQINIVQGVSSFTEKAIGNQFFVEAPDAKIIIEKNASVRGMELTPSAVSDSGIRIQGDDSTIMGSINVKAAGRISISGSLSGTNDGLVSVVVADTAQGTIITSDKAISVDTDVNITVELDEDIQAQEI